MPKESVLERVDRHQKKNNRKFRGKTRDWFWVFIPLRPIGMARRKVAKHIDEIYTKTTEDYQATILEWFNANRKEKKYPWLMPLHGSVEVELIFVTPRPVEKLAKSYPKTPNLLTSAHIVLSALEGSAWVDTKQITKLTLSKSFGANGTVIRFKRLTEI